MYINPIIFVSFLGSLILVSFAFIYLYYLYNRDREIRRKEQDLYQESSQLFEQESQKMLSGSQEELNRIAASLLSSYTKTFSDLKADSVVRTTQAVKQMQEHAEAQVQEFSQLLKKQTTESQHEIAKKISASIEASNEEIEKYKKEQIEKVKSLISSASVVILSDVLSKSLSEEDQEQLVIEALERAKKERVL